MQLSLTQKFTKTICTLLACTIMVSHPLIAEADSSSQKITPKFNLGMNFLWDKGSASKLESSFQRMQQLGIKYARTDFEWRNVESKKGHYNWSKLDNMIKFAHKYNIELLPIVHYAPNWALPNINKPEGIYEVALSDNAYDDYANFLNAAIDRYGPNGNAPFAHTPIENWQIWNEPNTKEFWYMESGFFQKWDMVKAANKFVDFMHVVDKNLGNRRDRINIVHAGLSKSDITYMWHLWDKDPNYGKFFDIMAIHSYFFNPKGGVRPVDSLDKNDPTYSKIGFIGSKDDHGYLRKTFNVKHFLDLKKSPKPLWVTEIGFMANNSGSVPNNPWVIKENEALKFAKDTLNFFQTTKDTIGIERVYWFVLDDYAFPYDMGSFGVYRTDGSPRQGLKSMLNDYSR